MSGAFGINNDNEDEEIIRKLRAGEFHFVKPIKNGKSLKSPAWETWNWIVNDKNEIVKGKIGCIHCKTIRTYKSTMGTTTLKKHKDECLNTAARKSLSMLAKNEEMTVKTVLNKKVVRFVAQDIRPFRTTSCAGFHDLAYTLIAIGHRYGPLRAKDVLPGRTTVSKLVTKEADDERFNLMMKLSAIQCQGIAVTLDLWTEDMTKCHYLGMNAHYITGGQLLENTLCVKELDEMSACAANIHIEVVNMLMVYDIDMENVVFVSDRGSEIVAALKDVACRLNCGDHILKNIVDYMFDQISPTNRIRDLLERCRCLVRYVKQSKIQFQLPSTLKNEVKTRWNATLTMFESIKKALEMDVLFEILHAKKRTELITDIDTELLAKLIELLELFQVATLYFEAKRRATIHYVALYRIKLENHLTVKNDDIPEIVQMKHHGLKYLREKWILDDIHKKAVFFHPKLKNSNIFGAETDNIIAEIRMEIQTIDTNTGSDDEQGDDEIPVMLPTRLKPTPKQLQQKDSIVDEFFISDLNVRPNDELQKYLDSPVIVPHDGQIELSEWWFENRKLYPALYKLSLKYLCIPAASATAETKFSLGGLVVIDTRASLNPQSVNDVLVLKSVFDKLDAAE